MLSWERLERGVESDIGHPICEVPGAGPRPLSDPTGPREPLG